LTRAVGQGNMDGMKNLSIGILLALSVINQSEARLGESTRDCDKRYGTPLAVTEEDGRMTRSYLKGDFRIDAAFDEDSRSWLRRARCESIRFTKPAKSGGSLPIEDQEIKALLDANSESQPWNEVNIFMEAARGSSIEQQSRTLQHGERFTVWRRKDGAAARHDRQEHVLTFRRAQVEGRDGGPGGKNDEAMQGF
jgi:hypothetical protein